MNTRGDVAANVRAALELVEAAADQGARLVALPETWAFKGRRDGILASAEALDGPSNARPGGSWRPGSASACSPAPSTSRRRGRPRRTTPRRSSARTAICAPCIARSTCST